MNNHTIKKRPKAIVFVGYMHKKDTIQAVQNAKFKTILITAKPKKEIEKNLFNEIITTDLSDKKKLSELIQHLKSNYNIKSVISNYEHFVVPRSYLAEQLEVPSCSIYSACCTRNKAMQRHALKFMKENIDYRVIKTKTQAIKAFKALGGDIFIKSISGIKSRLIFHAKTEKQIEKAFETMKKSETSLDNDLYDDYSYCDFQFQYPDPKSTFLVEKAIAGEQVTVASFVDSHHVWHAPSICDIYTASDIGRNDSFLAFRIIPSKHPKEIIEKAKATVKTAIRILGLQHCSIHAELIIDKNNDLKLIEIASRTGGYRGVMYKEAYGIDLNDALVKAVINKKITAKKSPKEFVSVIEIFPKKEGTFQEIKNLDLIKNNHQVKSLVIKAKKGDKVGLSKNGYQQILSFMLVTKTYKEAKEKSIFYHQNIEIEIK